MTTIARAGFVAPPKKKAVKLQISWINWYQSWEMTNWLFNYIFLLLSSAFIVQIQSEVSGSFSER